jgi:hypothetical protein
MASASASVTLTGKVRKTKIARDGTAVVVKKTLGDGTTLEERFPQRRMRGKRKANDQLIPVEDVIRGMEAYAETIEPEVQRRVEGVNQYANQLLDTEIAKERKKSDNRARYLIGKVVVQKKATRVAKKFVREIGDAVQVLARQGAQQSFADFVTAGVNPDVRASRRSCARRGASWPKRGARCRRGGTRGASRSRQTSRSRRSP